MTQKMSGSESLEWLRSFAYLGDFQLQVRELGSGTEEEAFGGQCDVVYIIEHVRLRLDNVVVEVRRWVRDGFGGLWIDHGARAFGVKAVYGFGDFGGDVARAKIVPNTGFMPLDLYVTFVPKGHELWIETRIPESVKISDQLRPGGGIKLLVSGRANGPLRADFIRTEAGLLPIVEEDRLLGALPDNLYNALSHDSAMLALLENGGYIFAFNMKLQRAGLPLPEKTHEGTGVTIQDAAQAAIQSQSL